MRARIALFIANPPAKLIANYCIGIGAICLFTGLAAGLLNIGTRAVVRHFHPGQIKTEEQMVEHMSGDKDIYLIAQDVTFGGVGAGAILLLVGSFLKIATKNEHDHAA